MDNWKNDVSQIDAEEYDIIGDPNFQTSSVTFTLDVLAKEAIDNMNKANKGNRAKSKTDM